MKDNTLGKWISLIFRSVLVIILLLVVVFLLLSFSRKSTRYSVLCLGDSIFGNITDGTSIPAQFASLSGMSTLNGGFGGTTACLQDTKHYPAYWGDYLTLTKLTDSIVNNDFSTQTASVRGCTNIEYFYSYVDRFAQMNTSDLQVIFIEHGVNDYLIGAPIDNSLDPMDRHSYGGALRYAITTLKAKFPDVRIILCTPTFCQFPLTGGDCTNTDFGGGYLIDYVNKELEIANEYNLTVLDNYSESGIGPSYDSMNLYTMDGTHLNEAGRALIAARMAGVIHE